MEDFPATIYFFKVNKGNTRTVCEMLFYTLLRCLRYWLWTSKYRLVFIFNHFQYKNSQLHFETGDGFFLAFAILKVGNTFLTILSTCRHINRDADSYFINPSLNNQIVYLKIFLF